MEEVLTEIRVEDVAREGAELPFPSLAELWRMNAYLRGGATLVMPLGPNDAPDLVHAWWRNAIGQSLRSDVRESADGEPEIAFWRERRRKT